MRISKWLIPFMLAAAASSAMAESRFYLVVPIPAANSGLPGSGGSNPSPTDPKPEEPAGKQYAINLEVLPGASGYDKWRLTDSIPESLYILYSSNNYFPDVNPPEMNESHHIYAYQNDYSIRHGAYYQKMYSRGTGVVPQLNEDPTEGSITYQSDTFWGTPPGIPSEGYWAFSLYLPYSSFKNGSQEFMFNAGSWIHPSNNFYCLKFVEKDGILTDGQLLSGACP